MIKSKLIKKSKDNDSIKNIFLPLSIHRLNTNNNNSPKIKKNNSINNKSSELKCKIDNNLIIYKNLAYPKNLFSPVNVNNKKSRNSSLSLSGNTNNFYNFYSYTSPNVYRQILAKYKKDKNYNSQRNNNIELKNSFFNENLKTSNINSLEEKEIKEKIQIFPIVKKFSLRNIFCDEKYHNEQIRDLIDNKKEKETEINKNEIKKTKEYEKKVFPNKIINNIESNIQNNIKKRESFNKKKDSEKYVNFKEKYNSYNNEIKEINKKNINKNSLNSLSQNNNIKIIKNNHSNKSYFLHRFTPRRKKNNNDDIMNLLNLES